MINSTYDFVIILTRIPDIIYTDTYYSKSTVKLYFLKTYYSNMIITHVHSTKTKVTMMKVYEQSLLIYQLQYSLLIF